MPDVILLNIHGGFPSAMTKRAMVELDAFRDLASGAEVYERAYPTNACAGPALHDIVMDAPLSSMTDSCWHDWSHARTTSRSLFHVFRQHGYHTRLHGAFGLDRRLDPHAHMHTPCERLATSLTMHGVDEYDLQDPAFTCQLGLAHDRDTLERVVSSIREPSRPANAFTMVNLLGCQDAHKCCFRDVDPRRVVIPSMDFEGVNYDERIFSGAVVRDDPRNPASASHRHPALRRAAQLHDQLRHADSVTLSHESLVRTVTGLHRFSWKCLQQLNEGLRRVVQALHDSDRYSDAVIYLFTDHPMSLYEHGEFCEAPWDACLRGFLFRKAPTVAARRVDSPMSLSDLPHMLFSDCALSCVWHGEVALDHTCLTLGLAVSWLARASVHPPCSILKLRTFFVRATVQHNDRVYAVVFWFSLHDMACASGLADGREEPVLSRIYQQHTSWNNPVLVQSLLMFGDRGALQAYDLVSDRHEQNDLSQHPEWCRSDAAAAIKNAVNAALIHHRLESILLKIPQNVHAMDAERASVCSVQLYHRVRNTILPDISPSTSHPTVGCSKTVTRDACTQTDEMSLEEALTSMFGSDVSSAIASMLVFESGPVTVFVPDDPSQQKSLPAWVPPPLQGRYSPDALLATESCGHPVTDTKVGKTHQLVRTRNGDVQFAGVRILLASATHIHCSEGAAICYMVQDETDKNVSTGDRDKTALLDRVADERTDRKSSTGSAELVDHNLMLSSSPSFMSSSAHTNDDSEKTPHKAKTNRRSGGMQPNRRSTVAARLNVMSASKVRGSVRAKELGQNVRKR